jgi:acyl-CoA dehydrogenase
MEEGPERSFDPGLDEVEGTREVLEKARDFRRRFIDPVAGELDRRLLLDPHGSPDEIIRKGCDYGFFSLPVPRFIGGGGGTVTQCAVLLEELCAGCAGIANIFGAHYLGLSSVLLSLDLSHYDRSLREVVEGERKGVPVIFSAAITEPTAGTDVEDPELLKRARLMTSARKVEGGYLLNGRKVFISNGSIASYHAVVCALERERPFETFSGFVVPAGAKGFSVGRVELKMGQRACHAAELVFEDCFLPEESRIGVEGKAAYLTEIVLASSRAPVAAIATGIARGAFEKALAFARGRQGAGGRPLIEAQWVQQALADMAGKIQCARRCYLAAARWADASILEPLLGNPMVTDPVMKALGPLRRTRAGRRITSGEACRRFTSGYVERKIRNRRGEIALGLSSLAKFSCSDLAMQVCLQGIDILGNEGAREENLVEKCLRDAKLTQIYEGTNQLNRRAAYQNLVRGAGGSGDSGGTP